jgi:hypothetical protein
MGHGRERERFHEQHVAELPSRHLDRRLGIEGAFSPLLADLTGVGTNATGDLPGPSRLRQVYLYGLLPPA